MRACSVTSGQQNNVITIHVRVPGGPGVHRCMPTFCVHIPNLVENTAFCDYMLFMLHEQFTELIPDSDTFLNETESCILSDVLSLNPNVLLQNGIPTRLIVVYTS